MPSSALIMVVAAALAQAAPPPPPATHYKGLCEASAAVRLDGDRFAMASDEADKLKGMENKLLIYRRGQAEPVGEATLKDVRDLEAAAAGGGRIFWITSHSLKKDGEDSDKRRALVATSVSGQTLAVDGRFKGLRAHLAALLRVDEWLLEGSINIEGMAVTPEGDLLVGLRGRLNDKKAGVFKIRDAAGLTSGQPAAPPPAPTEAKSVWWLDLNGRGIRSLERVGTGPRAYLIVAGATGEEEAEPALFWWDGASDAATPGPRWPGENGQLPSGFTPEAAIVWGDGTIEIFGDNEFRKSGDDELGCSDEDHTSDKRWFPSLLIRP